MEPNGPGERDATYFFEQRSYNHIRKRYKKQPDELPHDLRYAHLNPRVAAILANKEKEQKEEEKPFDDGLGQKSLLPQIHQKVSLIQHQFNSIDGDAQRHLYQQTKRNSDSLLEALARVLYLWEGLRPTLPRYLDHQLLLGWKELIAEAQLVQREWQVPENKEKYSSASKGEQAGKDESLGDGMVAGKEGPSSRADGGEEGAGREDGKRTKSKLTSSRAGGMEAGEMTPRDGAATASKDSSMPTILVHKKDTRKESLVTPSPKPGPKTRLEKYKTGLYLDPHGGRPGSALGGSRQSVMGGRMKRVDDSTSILAESVSEGTRSVMGGGGQQGYWHVIQFQLSSKACDDKGWIIHPDAQADRERETVMEWITQRLQLSIKQRKEQNEKEKEDGNDRAMVLRYYGDAMKEQVQRYKRPGGPRAATGLLRSGQLPRVPPTAPPDPDKRLFMVTVGDGSTTIFYPSGRPAIVSSKSGVGGGRPGYYTFVFDDSPERAMRACFTPAGRGCTYHDNGHVNFLAAEKGGTMADSAGVINKRWNWPTAGGKLPVTIILQLNSSVTLRCVTQHQMHLFFNQQKEHSKVHTGMTTGAETCVTRDDLGHLISGLPFTSLAAKEFSKPYKPKQPSRNKIRGPKGRTPNGEEISSEGRESLVTFSEVEIVYEIPKVSIQEPPSSTKASQELLKVLDIPEPTENDAEADKELYKLQRKIKLLVEDWLDHYRLAVGITPPNLKHMRDTPGRVRNIASAASSPATAGRAAIDREATAVPRAAPTARAPSAPLPASHRDRPQSCRSVPPAGPAPDPDPQTTVKFDERTDHPRDELTSAAGRSTSFSPSCGSGSFHTARSSRSKSAPHKFAISLCGEGSAPPPTPGLCPVALRLARLTGEHAACRCSRHRVPFITDIEFDEFINDHAPHNQLIVIAIVSSLYPQQTHGEELMEELHSERNRNRTRPCMQSRQDAWRVMCYDVATAAEYSDHSQPLLLRRHNVIPGMYLAYESGVLVFCDHIFNGYGNARKDFHKQLLTTRRAALTGHRLPKDFRFSPQHGRRGLRAAWGGQIGGAGVDRHGSAGLSLENGALKRASWTSLSSGGSSDLQTNVHVSGVTSLSSMKFVRAGLSQVAFEMSGRLGNRSSSVSQSATATGAAASPPQGILKPTPNPRGATTLGLLRVSVQ